MGKIYPEITEKLKAWLYAQKIFFVSTAPLLADGHINCSPKGLDTFRVVGAQEVLYLDLIGSGIETIAHLKENGRIVLMFCAFDGPTRIVRLHGHGTVHERGTPGFAAFEPLFLPLQGRRAIIHIQLRRIADSCGYGVPLYEYKGQRETLIKWAITKGDERIKEYQRQENLTSLDGLPGLSLESIDAATSHVHE